MAVLVHNRRQTSLLVVCLLPAVVTSQNDGLWQAGSQVNNPCPVGFRVPTLAEWEAETDYKFSYCRETQTSWAGQRFANTTLTGTGDSGLLGASVNGTNAARIRVDDSGGVSFGANERARVVSALPQRLAIILFFLPLEQEVYIDVGA
jgi:hypothetical protein